jgi:hypothetical protein
MAVMIIGVDGDIKEKHQESRSGKNIPDGFFEMKLILIPLERSKFY